MALSVTAGDSAPDVAAWDALCDETGATPFLRPEWILPWCAAFANGETYFVSAFDDGRLTGVLPLRRRFGVLSSTTNWHSPIYAPVAASEEVEAALLRHAARAAAALILRFVPADASATAVFAQVCRNEGMSLRSRELLRSPRVDI